MATSSGLLEGLSEVVMGDEEKLVELVESIHYTLFMVRGKWASIKHKWAC